MINILIGNDYLDLFSDTQVSVNFSNNNLGGENTSFVTYSESVEIPLTDRNASIFQINKADKTIGRQLSIGSIVNDGEVVMSITCEIQSVEIGSLEEKISLLVMDAVSGIMKDLKKRKLDILFDKELNDGFYFKRNANNVSNKLYRYGFVETNGYNASINPSEYTKYVYTAKLKDEAIPRMIFNVNECFRRIFKHYGLSSDVIFDEDLFTTIPYKELTGKKVVEVSNDFYVDFKAPTLQKKALGQSNLTPSQENMNKIVKNVDCLYQFNSTLDTDFINKEDVAKASGASGYDGIFISKYSGFYNSGEYILLADKLDRLVGYKFKYILQKSGEEKDFWYTDLTDAELFITIKERFDSISKNIPVAKLKISSDCKISDVIPTDEFLYNGKTSIKSGESFSIFFSIRFSGNGTFHNINTEAVSVSLGTIYAYQPIILTLKSNSGVGNSPRITLAPADKNRNSNVNDILDGYGFYDYRIGSFNLSKYNEIVSQMESISDNPDINIREIVSIHSSLKEADITAYDFVLEQCNRFNKRIIIINGVVSETSMVNNEVFIIDELNSEFTVTPKDFENEIRSITIKNKSYNSKYDKIYTGNGSFDSDEIVINEDSKSNKVIQLKSAPIPDSVVGDGYIVNDSQSELVNKYGMIPSGITQFKPVSSKEMEYRIGYTGSKPTLCASLYPKMHGWNIIDMYGVVKSKENSDISSVVYTTESGVIMNAVVSDILGDVEFDIPAKYYNNMSFSGEYTQINLKARISYGIMCVQLPSENNFSVEMELTSVQELLHPEYDDGHKVTNTLYNKLPLFNIFNVEDIYIRAEYDETAECNIIAKGANTNMKITVSGKSIWNNPSRICIPIATGNMIASATLKDSDLTKSYPPLLSFSEENILGYGSVSSFLSYNTKYSLSFNNLTAKGKKNALDRFFSESISMISGDKNPYVSVDIMTTVDNARKIISGAKLNIRGVVYQIVEANDINLGDKSIIKVKLTR